MIENNWGSSLQITESVFCRLDPSVTPFGRGGGYSISRGDNITIWAAETVGKGLHGGKRDHDGTESNKHFHTFFSFSLFYIFNPGNCFAYS